MKKQPLTIIVRLAQDELKPVNTTTAKRVRSAVARLAESTRSTAEASRMQELETACEHLLKSARTRRADWRTKHTRETWAQVILDLCEDLRVSRGS